ncbi:hypothetical protein HYFRA_00000244 [Hymenoscyphus fraxineus]|uniref:Uncharacterized protein n=1 Tax=Hymenoscyphus fraxineus TaxID=746836 RepID=A0A9N9L4B7_9HELO|nr:hypothetical protein HYFRA_00000244 [Hymenoscyphus fraxineus]
MDIDKLELELQNELIEHYFTTILHENQRVLENSQQASENLQQEKPRPIVRTIDHKNLDLYIICNGREELRADFWRSIPKRIGKVESDLNRTQIWNATNKLQLAFLDYFIITYNGLGETQIKVLKNEREKVKAYQGEVFRIQHDTTFSLSVMSCGNSSSGPYIHEFLEGVIEQGIRTRASVAPNESRGQIKGQVLDALEKGYKRKIEKYDRLIDMATTNWLKEIIPMNSF